MNVSVQQALELKGSEQIIADPKFRDPITRLRVLKGELNLLASQARELYRLSKRLREGSTGLSARVAGTWLSEALLEARRAENHHTLTPIILRNVYDRLVDEDAMEIPDIETRLRWKSLMDKVVEGVLIPKLQNDIYVAFDRTERVAEIYDSLIQEMNELALDEGATEYTNSLGTIVPIDRKRLEAIKGIYERQTGRPLAIHQIAQFYLQMMQLAPNASAGQPARNSELLAAIREFLAVKLDGYVSIVDLLACAEKNDGNAKTREKYRSVEQSLIQRLGYNQQAILDALRIIKQYREKLDSRSATRS